MDDPNLTIIAIDGPAGTGKSTVARLLAQKLSYLYLDTGAMYRAITWQALHEKVDLEDERALADLANRTRLKLVPEANGMRVFANGREITDEIRSPEVTRAVAYVDKVPGVRQAMAQLQRDAARSGRIVAEGRDMGTVIFPDAACKIYLDASVDERARRRSHELRQQGLALNIEKVKEDIVARDTKNMRRTIAPLRQADDAVRLDTTDMSIDEVVEHLHAIAESKRRERLHVAARRRGSPSVEGTER